MNRRELIRNLSLAAASIPPSRAAFAGIFAPSPMNASDKLTVACIGVGSQGLRVLLDMLRLPEVQIVAARTHESLLRDTCRFSFTQGSERATALPKPPYRSPCTL